MTLRFGPEAIYRDPITITALAIAGAAGAAGASAISSSQQRSAEKKQQAAMDAANAKADAATANTPQVENKPASDNASRIGRAALISTSPLGVQTTDPTGRRKLLGNV